MGNCMWQSSYNWPSQRCMQTAQFCKCRLRVMVAIPVQSIYNGVCFFSRGNVY